MCRRIALYNDPDHLARLLDAGVDPELLVRLEAVALQGDTGLNSL